MSPEWLTAIGTLGTFVVIAASAMAALVQLRHMRASNQLSAITELFEIFESPAFQDARRFVNHEFPQLMQDPENRKRAMEAPIPKEFEQARMILGFFENVGTLVKRGIIDADILFDLWSPIIIGLWQRLSGFVVSTRALRGNPALYENFEYLTARAQTWMATHATGSYPPGIPRMKSDPAWPEALQK